MAKIRFKGKVYQIPGSRKSRIFFGWLLIILGIFGFLPIIGFWMIPLGLLVLSVDNKRIRMQRRRFVLWWGRWRLIARSGENAEKVSQCDNESSKK